MCGSNPMKGIFFFVLSHNTSDICLVHGSIHIVANTIGRFMGIPCWSLSGMQSLRKFESRSQRWLCHSVQKQVTDLGVPALDRGQLGDYKALTRVIILF